MTQQTQMQLINVSSLICHSNIQMALTCLGTLLRFSHEPVHLILHDDGTLNEEDMILLAAGLNEPTIIRKQEADERMEEALKFYPNASKFRSKNVLSRKLFDTVEFNSQDPYTYCDCDILFLKPFTCLFELPQGPNYSLFMADITHSYCVRSWHPLLSKGLKLPKHFNSGLICFRRSYYDLDFIEWFLSNTSFHATPYFIEQTAWALLGWRSSCRFYDPEQVTFMSPKTEWSDQRVAGHFVTNYRHLLDDYVAKLNLVSNDQVPIELKTVPVTECFPHDLALVELKRVLGRSPLRFALKEL